MLDYIIEISACIADAFLAMFFITSFNKNRIKNNVLFWVFILIHSGFNSLMLFLTSFSTNASIINAIILVVYSFLNRESTIFRKLVAPFAFESALIVVNSLIASILSLMLDLPIAMIFSGRGLTRILALATCKILLWIVLFLILNFVKEDSMRFQDYFLLILFSITAFFELAFLLKISLNYDISNLYIYLFMACLLIISSNIGIYYLVYRISKNNELESEKELYKQMLTLETKRYQDMTESYTQIRQIRHDIKNQLLSVGSKISDNDFEAAKDNLENILAEVENTGKIVNCGNRVIDYIVNVKLNSIKNAKILVYGDASKANIVSDLELSILLGNLLDNAIEAIKDDEKPEIELYFTVKNGYQSILCKNSINKSILKNNPELHTTKTGKSSHGYGIRSIINITEKNHGYVEIFEEKQKFCVQILLPLN